MDLNNLNNHGMLTRSKRKRNVVDQNTENIVLSISRVDEINSKDFVELSEDFLIEEEIEEEAKKHKVSHNYIHPEMRDFIVPDDIESSDVNSANSVSSESTESTESADSEDEDDYEDEDEIEKSERELAEALACYINQRMDVLDDTNNKNIKLQEEVFTMYDKKMQQHYLSLPKEEQEKILKLENEIKKMNNEVVPLRYQLLNSEMDLKVKSIAMRKLNAISQMDTSSGEYYKLSTYIDGLMKIPFGKFQDLPITKDDTNSNITDYMINCSRILDEAVHGHQKAKSQIIQTVGKWISNPQSKGSVFSILGPMGNGKTTLVKEGIAKMINRPFEFISLGGATDSSFLDGHSYTYEGAVPGRIVEILKKAKCMNPVIYFDELDKVSSTPRGEEIINLLIHLTDFSQNDHFMDKYYSDVPLDLSKALFIFSLNNMENVNPILRDRMMMIQTDKLLEEDKKIISEKYMIPRILKEINLEREDIIFPEETIKLAISKYSPDEGVRNLKRAYETLLEKINILKLVKLDENESKKLNFSKSMQKIILEKVEFPLTITPKMFQMLVDETDGSHKPPFMMYT